MRIAALLLLVFLAIGCATSDPLVAHKAGFWEWKRGDFQVSFQAGPQDSAGRSYSHYTVRHSAAGEEQRELVMGSAHTLGGFRSVTDGNGGEWIRIVEDPSGRAILIEEKIPNDCNPCSNYLWVYLDKSGFLVGKYLLLPSEVSGPPGGIDYELPEVRSLDGNELVFSFSGGSIVTKRMDEIEMADRPTPPG